MVWTKNSMAGVGKTTMPRFPPSPSMRAKSVASDDYTLYSDADSVCSDNSSTDSFVSYRTHDELPAFQLPKADAHQKDVYEAWTIYLSADYKASVSARKICGITATEDFDSYQGMISTISELYDQKDLMEMHFKALDKYQAKHKRNWPSRIVRGRGPSYEENIDSRIRKLPDAVQSEISNLLADREESSSNRFHNRAWTVVMMQEQLHRRFANADPTVVSKRHKVRFWKNPGKNQRSEYLFIIRGGEGRRIREEKGQSEFKRFENPWRKADEAEMWKKATQHRTRRSERIKASAKAAPPSYRYRVPPASPPSVFDPPRPGRYYSRPAGAMSPPPIRSYAAPPPLPPPIPWSYPPPPAPTPPASYPTPPPVRCAQSTNYCPPRPPYMDLSPALRPAPMYELPSYSQQQRPWGPRGDPNGCCGPAAGYNPPMRQPVPTWNPQSHRRFEQALAPSHSAFRPGTFNPSLSDPGPQPEVMSAEAPLRMATPGSISCESSSASSPGTSVQGVTNNFVRGCHVDDYESDDEDTSVITGGTKPSSSADEAGKDETKGEDKESTGKR